MGTVSAEVLKAKTSFDPNFCVLALFGFTPVNMNSLRITTCVELQGHPPVK
jgi:hypothetical protein